MTGADAVSEGLRERGYRVPSSLVVPTRSGHRTRVEFARGSDASTTSVLVLDPAGRLVSGHGPLSGVGSELTDEPYAHATSAAVSNTDFRRLADRLDELGTERVASVVLGLVEVLSSSAPAPVPDDLVSACYFVLGREEFPAEALATVTAVVDDVASDAPVEWVVRRLLAPADGARP